MSSSSIPRPFGLLAEVTHRCPLHCPYCSNPTQYAISSDELATGEWKKVLNEAAELGVLHAGFSGGEPLQRPDIPELIAAARGAGLYTNLITSAIGLSRALTDELKQSGLDSIQISFQSDKAELADRIAGTSAHAKKIEAAQWVRESNIPLSLNVVLHRGNIARLPQIILLAENLGAERLELANTQYYGWAFKNLSTLLPSREQLVEAEKTAAAARQRLLGQMEIIYVMPDYYSERPKPCMNGWGRRHITVNPVGNVLPCPTAGEIKGLAFDNVRQKSLQWIWANSPAFNRFRGTEWMPEPCRSCDQREIDFGGCRCQAALLTGDPAATDPACSLSPFRSAIEKMVASAQKEITIGPFTGATAAGIVYRSNPEN